ncbi:MAG: nitroreductase family protein [Acidimicrobiia bacterium]|nr:nitroreductase family protein [Acidimicrobiia bacterium]
MTDMYDRILRLRAIRTYDDRQLSDDDLDRILEAARWTGSSKNRQNWSWVVIQNPEQRLRFAEAGSFTDPVRNAPTVLALVQEPDGYEMDTGRLAQNIMLAADAIGVASCPITLHHEDRAAEVLGLPDGRRCGYAVTLGYPGVGASPARMGGRKPMEELRHSERYTA